jgi:hypothetical protein
LGLLGLGAAAIGATVALGWLLGLHRLTDCAASEPEAELDAGVCALLLGTALWLVLSDVVMPRMGGVQIYVRWCSRA